MIGHDGKFGTLAVAFAFHDTVDPDNVPLAVPDTRISPGHVALNVPRAVLPVCSVTFQRKSVHDVGEGTALADDQLPSSAALPVVVGLVELLRS